MPRAGATCDARGPQPSPTDPPPPSHPHQALFAAVRCGDTATARAFLAAAEASGASLAALAGEAAAYVAAEAEREEVVRFVLSLYEFKAADVSARLDLDTFLILSMRGWVGEAPPPRLRSSLFVLILGAVPMLESCELVGVIDEQHPAALSDGWSLEGSPEDSPLMLD